MNLQTLLINFGVFLNATILPFLLALGGMFFIWHAARYFIIGGANPDDQQKARTLALWGLLAFVLILSLWGIVSLMVNGFGLGQRQAITPDYIQEKGGGSSNNNAFPDNDEGYRLPGGYTGTTDNTSNDTGFPDLDEGYKLPDGYTDANAEGQNNDWFPVDENGNKRPGGIW